MDYKDYYKTLGVDKGADEKEIKKAYRRLARQFHPDMNPGDKAAEARFKEINEANEVLSDAEKRRKYDELGSKDLPEEYVQSLKSHGAEVFPFNTTQGSGNRFRLNFRNRREVAVVVEHRVIIGEIDPALDSREDRPELEPVKLDPDVALLELQAGKCAHEIEMPERPPEFAVGHGLQTDALLHLDGLTYRLVFDRL